MRAIEYLIRVEDVLKEKTPGLKEDEGSVDVHLVVNHLTLDQSLKPQLFLAFTRQ